MNPKKIKKVLRRRNKPPRILIVRNDGLGDFILTLPFIASLKKQVPDSKIYVLINKNIQLMIPMLADIDGAIVDEGVLLRRHRKNFSAREKSQKRNELELEIKAYNFDVAIMLYAEGESAHLIKRCEIPIRVGPLRRWYFYRFNAHYKRSRKKSNKSEYSLNLSYLNELGLRADFTRPVVREMRDDWPLPGRARKKYAVLHAYKRAKTALAWPPERFAQLAKTLLAQKYQVIAIGDAHDADELAKIFAEVPEVVLATDLTLRQMFRVMITARLFIGNSSGPLHVAALLGVPHVGLFPQNRVSSPRRWKTIPSEQGPAFQKYLLQPHFEKNCVGCELQKCQFYNCVEAIELAEVEKAISLWQESVKPPKKTAKKKSAVTKKTKVVAAPRKKASKKKTPAKKTKKKRS